MCTASAGACTHGLRGLHGGGVRNEATEGSDIDFLVEFEPSSSLLDLIHVEEVLAWLLGTGFDVVSVGALLDRYDDIRRDAIAL